MRRRVSHRDAGATIDPTATTTPTAAPTSAPTTTAPLATFATTSELAASPPPGAVALDLTFVHDQPRFQPNAIQA